MTLSLPCHPGEIIRGVGVTATRKQIFLFYATTHDAKTRLCIASSQDGLAFSNIGIPAYMQDRAGNEINPAFVDTFRITRINNKYFLTFAYQDKGKRLLYGAISYDFFHWKTIGKIPAAGSAMVVPNVRVHDASVMILSTKTIRTATSSDLKKWNLTDKPILQLAGTHLCVTDVVGTPHGTLLVYTQRESITSPYTLRAALFDPDNPTKFLWKPQEPIWEQTEPELADKNLRPVGSILSDGRCISYWQIPDKGIYAIEHTSVQHLFDEPRRIPSILSRIVENPILKPITKHVWESKAVFNPAALYSHGKVHLIYRAIGENDTSVLGYAASHDGVHIDERLDEPIYTPSEPFEWTGKRGFAAVNYMSGGGYGGVEDPRITKVGDTLYVTYVAFNGCEPPRIAITSIREEDFLAKRWRWKKPVLISRPGTVNKNAVILPEKINGKFAIFHRIFPNILIDYVDDLNFDGSTFLETKSMISPRKTFWDSRKIGAGPTPIKTDRGWLLIYHAVDNRDPGRYKIGAMLLDTQHPSRVLARSKKPLLAPDCHYENEGYKSGVVYPCGAVTIDNDLLVYYGGADTVVCAARAYLPSFLDALARDESPRLSPIRFGTN